MPTPVATAKQCLTPEAAHALDEAVAVACGRSHAQTTSLHAVSAFLSLPSSPLREACFRARNAAFCYYSSSRAQIKALDFALSLSLDRSPASQQRVSEPPISNSLMAAIKRSQANQRRQPDSFGYKQEQAKEQLGTSGIKVEIRNLIVAILDDPIVSRVFNEAGFSSFDLKLAMVRPLQGFWRYSNSFGPRQRIHRSMLFCNQEENPNPILRPFKFPFSGDSCGDEDFRRVGEVLVRKQGRNPLLFGVCAYDALQGFVEAVRTQDQFLPSEIRGVTVVSVEREISKFLSENSGEEMMKSRFEELSAMVEGCCGPGLIICLGDLNAFVKDDHDLSVDLLSGLIDKFTKFLGVFKERVWLIGCATYEIYLKLLCKFPCVEKDWDLQPLAITSMKFSKGSSLMGSFVPFAGFFPPSSDFGGMSRSSYQLPTRSNLCNEKRAQEAMIGSGYDSVADRCQTALPSWLRMDKISTSNRSDTLKAKDDAVVLIPTTEVPFVEGKSSTKEEKAPIDNKSSDNVNASIKGSDQRSLVPKFGYKGPHGMLDSGVNDCQTPLSSGTSVATDLVLGVSSHSCHDSNDFKSLFKALIRRIDGQEEAVRIISQTVSHTRTSNGRLKGSRIRGDVWMNFTGPDTFGMRETAMALAEVVCGSKGSFIHADLSLQDGLVDQCTVFGNRRRTTIDHIADSLRKTPSSVVFLENLHLAHPPAQNSLLHAIRTGKFLDSHGREVGIGNTIFLLSSTLETVASEVDRVTKPKPWPMQIIVNAPSSLLNKRKLHSTNEPVKRPHKGGSVTCLDLNLPADDNTNEAWLEELSRKVDATVVFKPFDYDALSRKTTSLIQGCFSKSFCPGCVLEIDPRAMDQLLAAAQLSEKKTEVGEWSENVLSKWFAEARKRYHNFAGHSVVKLATVRPLYREEEQEACEWLPSKMILHWRPLESL